MLFDINLQLFADEYEDFILPDETEPALPEAIEAPVETVEDTKPTEETIDTEGKTEAEVKEEVRKLKVKYNHEEMELGEDEAIPLIQKGMNYDKTIEKLNQLQSDPRLSFVEELAKQNNMTPQQYIEAVREQTEQDKLNKLVEQNIPEELAKEILEGRKDRESRTAKERQQQEQQSKQQEYNEFLQNYPDVKPDEIPKEVWEYKEKTGKALADSMLWHENQQMKEKLKVYEKNKENKDKAPVGSLTAHGTESVASEDDFLKGFDSI